MAKVKEFTHRGVIAQITRQRSSTNGNPRFLVRFEDGKAWKTGVDASVAYGIENPEFRAPNVVEVTVYGAQENIIGITVVK